MLQIENIARKATVLDSGYSPRMYVHQRMSSPPPSQRRLAGICAGQELLDLLLIFGGSEGDGKH
jgi:hypothetical protein